MHDTPNLTCLLSWSAGTSQLCETRRPDTSGEGHVVTIHRSGTSQSITWRCHSLSAGDIRTHRSVTSPSIAWGSHKRPSSPTPLAHVSGATAKPLPLPPPSLVLCLALVFYASHRGLGHVFPGPRQIALAMADVSRHMQQEGSFDNTSCLPGRLQDKVPQTLPTPQHCWPALWAPLLPPRGDQRQHLACFRGFSPTC